MHNHRREQFFRAQQAARARELMLDRYIAERVANQSPGQPRGQRGCAACSSQVRR